MMITNIKIKDFRNIVHADINLRALNVLTGRNSSGKTNFLLALSSALSQERDYSEKFQNNTVTLHRGKDSATISATLGDINSEVCYIYSDRRFLCLSPKEFRFEKIIGKNSLSRSHRLYFSGKFYSNDRDKNVRWETFKGAKENLYRDIENELVYEEFFSKEVEKGSTKIVRVSKSTFSNQEEYLRYLSNLNSVVSWVGKTDEMHDFVTARGSRETYEQAADRIKSKVESGFSHQPFEKASFIFLLADLYRNPSQYANFTNDLKIYTNGIVSSITISEKGPNRGEIFIESPNGPSDIWTISKGTSILVFLITLLNWMRLPERDKSFIAPNIMIFDEIDSLIHPSLMPHFKELLELISKKTQIFMSTHSPYFIDGFSREEVLLLKDTPSLSGSKKIQANRCNIYSYQQIIENFPNNLDSLENKKNSELFVDGLIDTLFPSHEV